MTDINIWKSRRLPHWQSKSEAAYFITFRLHGAIPQAVIAQYQKDLSSNLPVIQRQAELRKRLEHYLDQQQNALLADPRAATIVKDTLLFGAGSQYQLIAWTVMPNHVHVVFTQGNEAGIDKTVQAWKSVSAHRINQLLHRTGKLWQSDYYDKIMRNERMMARAVQYVRENPEKAGLRNWLFVG